MKDCLNRKIVVGSYIAYAMTQGRSAAMRFYEILEVFDRVVVAKKFRGFDKDGNPQFASSVQLTGADRALMIPPSEVLNQLKS